MPKVNSELFSLTYGSMVMQLIKDYEDVTVVNQQLEKMGHNIGCRIIDEFLSKSGITNCSSFRETADVIAKTAFRMFLGIRYIRYKIMFAALNDVHTTSRFSYLS